MVVAAQNCHLPASVVAMAALPHCLATPVPKLAGGRETFPLSITAPCFLELGLLCSSIF